LRVLALDLSSSTGYAILEGEPDSIPKVLRSGTIVCPDADPRYAGHYPWALRNRCAKMVDAIEMGVGVTTLSSVDHIVIEETNLGRNRYSQKMLEWIHLNVLHLLASYGATVWYINTSDWRRKLGTTLTAEDKKLNAKVRKLKKSGDKAGLKALGVRGKIGKKHVAVRFVNQTYNLGLKLKDNDQADAICLGVAYFLGVSTCDGK
jgi:hypothetical protein